MQGLRLFHFDIPTWGNFGDKALFPVVRDAFRVLGGTDEASGEPNFAFASAAALRLVIAAVCVYLLVALICVQMDIVSKRQQLDNITAQVQAQQAARIRDQMQVRHRTDTRAMML